MSQEIVDIGRLVFELTMYSGNSTDLDQLLARLLDILKQSPALRLTQQAAIVLYNPDGEPIQVAQHGIDPLWTTPRDWRRLLPAQAVAAEQPVLAGTDDSVAGLGHYLALSLVGQRGSIGHAVFCVAAEYAPDASHLDFMRDLGRSLSVLVGRALLDEVVKVREWQLEDARTEAIHRLGAASEYRDTETGWHVMRMTNFALAIAKQLDLPDAMRELLFITAPMHDVGKIGIPDAILLKPGLLTDEEMEVMRQHAEIGETILKGHDAMITTAREIAGAHHEHWDGSGYPRGLRGEGIPILARICAVADVFDALTSSRPYKDAWPVEQAIDWIYEQSGSQFDPAVVVAFRAALPNILRIRELYRDDIIDPHQVLALPQPAERSHRWAAWDDSLRVGIDVIDEHHRHLFDLINDLYDVVVDKRGSREVARLLKALDLYAHVHFDAEERMMAHYRYPGLAVQHDQHQGFHAKLKSFHLELHGNPLTAQYDVLSYLRNWLVGHIRHEDAELRVLVATAV